VAIGGRAGNAHRPYVAARTGDVLHYDGLAEALA
jgi:hypothetical protein